MKTDRVLDLMSAISPDLIEEADVQAPAKRHLPRAIRTGLIAACLCLAMIGTAAAVHYSGVRTETDEDGTVWSQGGIVRYSYDLFSDELKALKGEPSAKGFGSWQAMEDFIGFDLLDNPLLDAHPAHYSIFWSDTVRGRCVLSISADQDCMFPHALYSIGGYDIGLEGFLHTDHIPDDLKDFYENEWDAGTIGIPYQDDGSTKEIVQEAYTTPSGLDVQIVTKTQKDGFCILYAGFSIKGVAYTMNIPCHDKEGVSATTLEGGRAVLFQVLDSFVLSE